MSDLYTALSEQQQQELKLTGDAVRSRRQLSYFESHLSRIRQLLTTANGYFETYSIRKRALPSAMMALLDAVQLHKEGQPLPEDLIVTTPTDVQEALRSLKPGDPLPEEVQEVVQLAYWGPYLKYRWREDSAGPLYTIALGKISPAVSTDEGESEEEH